MSSSFFFFLPFVLFRWSILVRSITASCTSTSHFQTSVCISLFSAASFLAWLLPRLRLTSTSLHLDFTSTSVFSTSSYQLLLPSSSSHLSFSSFLLIFLPSHVLGLDISRLQQPHGPGQESGGPDPPDRAHAAARGRDHGRQPALCPRTQVGGQRGPQLRLRRHGRGARALVPERRRARHRVRVFHRQLPPPAPGGRLAHGLGQVQVEADGAARRALRPVRHPHPCFGQRAALAARRARGLARHRAPHRPQLARRAQCVLSLHGARRNGARGARGGWRGRGRPALQGGPGGARAPLVHGRGAAVGSFGADKRHLPASGLFVVAGGAVVVRRGVLPQVVARVHRVGHVLDLAPLELQPLLVRQRQRQACRRLERLGLGLRAGHRRNGNGRDVGLSGEAQSMRPRQPPGAAWRRVRA